jgi:leucyl-tRNA synthetase
MWSTLGYGEMIAKDGTWPEYDEAKCVDDTVEIAVQINGKIRAKIEVATDASNDEAIAAAKADEKIAEELNGKNIIKEIYVKGRLVNIVAK